MFHGLESEIRLRAVHNRDEMMDIDQGESIDDSIWGIGVLTIKHSFQSSKGSKILQSLIEELLYSVQQFRQAYIDGKKLGQPVMSRVRDVVQMLLSLGFYK